MRTTLAPVLCLLLVGCDETDELEAQVAALDAALATLRAEHEALAADQEALAADHEALAADHEALLAELDVVSGEVVDLAGRTAALEATSSALEPRVTALEAAVGGLGLTAVVRTQSFGSVPGGTHVVFVVACDEGERAVGGGAGFAGNLGAEEVQQSFPVDEGGAPAEDGEAPAGWASILKNNSGSAMVGTGYAVCARL